MTRERLRTCARPLAACFVLALLLSGGPARVEPAAAQSARPVLVSHTTSTRAVAFESVTQKREPFPLNSSVQFSSDRRTRVILFAMNLKLQAGETAAAVTADAEDAAHKVYQLKVESVAPVPDQPWLTSLVVRLSDELTDVGDVLVRVTYKGQPSNRVRVGVGHTGGGPPDDFGAVPTPGTPNPGPSPNASLAGDLTAAEVQRLIAQAVSAAAQLGRPVTVAVVDREGNVLGVFQMTNAPATTLIRGGGTSGRGLEGLTVPSTLAAVSKAGTAAFFSTTGNAFTTRTASFIIQQHFPPGVDNRPGGPLYGVQFSQLPCSDIKKPGLPLGLSADPGSMPIYRNGVAVGGIGIEGDGLYTLDRDPRTSTSPSKK